MIKQRLSSTEYRKKICFYGQKGRSDMKGMGSFSFGFIFR